MFSTIYDYIHLDKQTDNKDLDEDLVDKAASLKKMLMFERAMHYMALIIYRHLYTLYLNALVCIKLKSLKYLLGVFKL